MKVLNTYYKLSIVSGLQFYRIVGEVFSQDPRHLKCYVWQTKVIRNYVLEASLKMPLAFILSQINANSCSQCWDPLDKKMLIDRQTDSFSTLHSRYLARVIATSCSIYVHNVNILVGCTNSGICSSIKPINISSQVCNSARIKFCR